MNGSKEDLYSVTDARALSLHLSGARKIIDEEKTTPYIRFSSGIQTPTAVAPVPKAADISPPAQTLTLPSEPFRTWEAMLKWCVEVTESKSCFVVDPQGFILMSEGEHPPDDGYEGAGANLKLAIDQMRLMGMDKGEIQSLDVMYPETGMFVIQAQDAENDFFTLCFFGSRAMADAQKKVVFEQIQRSVLQLT